jgi:glycosyltransferase involved in cell wall biosynthesis
MAFPSGLAVIIPTLNPDGRLVALVSKLCSMGAKEIVIINDGSRESCEPIFFMLEKQCGVVVLHHPVNRGKGAALKTGIHYPSQVWRKYSPTGAQQSPTISMAAAARRWYS